MQKLTFEALKEVIKNTPLISIDLIIENPEGKVLLGFRNNQPAKGFWFVPGGRILKDEPFNKAFTRICHNETGLELTLSEASFYGIYEHIHQNDNFTGDPSFSTHYIVIAYKIKLKEDIINLPKEQHSDYWWATVDDIINNSKVHQNTKNYFNGYPSFSETIVKD